MLIRGKTEPTTLAYAAAALECEGSISLSRSFTKQGWHAMDVRISVANTDKNLMQLFLDTFGGTCYTEHPKKLSKKVIYRWKVCANKAVEFLKLVRPYMLMKGRQADLAVLFQKERRKLSIEEKDTYWKQMKALNRGESPAETKREETEPNLSNDSPTLVETPVSTTTATL